MTDDVKKTTPPPKLTAQPLAPVVDVSGFTASVIVAVGSMPGKGRAVVFFKDGQPVSSEPVLADQKGIATQRFDIAGGFKTPVSVGAVIMGGPTLQFTVNPLKDEKSKGKKNRILKAKLVGDEEADDSSSRRRVYQYFFLLNDENGRGVEQELEFAARPAKLKYESVSNGLLIENKRFWNDRVPASGILKSVMTVTEDVKVVVVMSGWPDDTLQLDLDGPKKRPDRRFFKNWT